MQANKQLSCCILKTNKEHGWTEQVVCLWFLSFAPPLMTEPAASWRYMNWTYTLNCHVSVALQCATLWVSSSDLAVTWWSRKLPPHSTWWGHWVRSAAWAEPRPSQSSLPGLRPGSNAGGRGPEMAPEAEPGLPSWLPTRERAVPHSWTCRNTGWTPPGWAVRHEVRTQSCPGSAVATGTASERAGRHVTSTLEKLLGRLFETLKYSGRYIWQVI